MDNNRNMVRLDYGLSGVEIRLDRNLADWDIIEPRTTPAAASFEKSFFESVSNPIGRPSLCELISPDDSVAIVTADATRPVPNRLLIPAVIEHCRLKPENVTILVGTGTHRPHSERELNELLGDEIITKCRVICHDASDDKMLEYIGDTESGIPVHMNKYYLHADKKIALGFIEPHFFAGYSGGAKGICPAICGLKTINAFHSFDIIGDPESDYGILEKNPQQRAARDVTAMAPPDFLINVILNSRKEITQIFSGHYIEAHREGCRTVSESAMVGVKRKYPLVITSNSGYPLDQNLYQTVKGIAAASLITEKGGHIIIASECRNGIPPDGNFAGIMESERDPESLLRKMADRKFKLTDRWQAQKLAGILRNVDVLVYSSLDAASIGKCKMRKIDNIQTTIADIATRLTDHPRIAVMPQGPLTIPYLKK